MRTVRLNRVVPLAAVAAGLALAACGGGGSSSSAKAYEGQWEYVSGGMVSGPDILNLRSDGTYSDVTYYSHTIEDLSGGVRAEKGTYTFTPDTPGGETQGTLAFHRTHVWQAGAWKASADDVSGALVITAGSPRTMSFDGSGDTFHYEYHAAQAAIPTSFPLAYQGQWKYVSGGMVVGPDVLNLRSDGTFSDVTYLSGTVGDVSGGVHAWKGTYTFTRTTPTDDSQGTLALHATHSWNGSAWVTDPGDTSAACVVAGGLPRTLTLGSTDYEYYGLEAAIPTSF